MKRYKGSFSEEAFIRVLYSKRALRRSSRVSEVNKDKSFFYLWYLLMVGVLVFIVNFM